MTYNSPCKDHFTHGKFASPWTLGDPWMAWEVFDGHSGAQTAELLKKQLLPFVRHSLTQVTSSADEESWSDDLAQRAIATGFLNLDDSIIKTVMETAQSQESLMQKVKKLAPAYAGSCALLSLYDSTTRTLHVACTSDSSAVLGQKRPNGHGKQKHCQLIRLAKTKKRSAGFARSILVKKTWSRTDGY